MRKNDILNSAVRGHEGPCVEVDFGWSTEYMTHLGRFRSVRRFLFFWWRHYGDEFEGLRRPFDSRVVHQPSKPIEERPPVGLLDKHGRVTSQMRGRNTGLARYPAPVPPPPQTAEDDWPHDSRRWVNAGTSPAPEEDTPPFQSGRGGDYAGAGASGSWEPAPTPAPQAFAGLSESSPSPAPEPESCRASDYSSSPPPSDPPSYDSSSSSSSSDSGSSSSGSSD
jgi:hypothetical protein